MQVDIQARGDSVGRWAALIGAGILATALAQPLVLDLPIRRLLLQELEVSPAEMASFFALFGLAWYVKPLAGLLVDAVPLFGTRRRHWLIASAILAGSFWLAAGWVPRTWWPLLLIFSAVNAMLVIGSTVTGALMAEAGQRLHAAGRLAAARIVVDEGCAVVAGPLAGLLASLPFALAGVGGAVIACCVVPFALIWLREAKVPRDPVPLLADSGRRLAEVCRSRPLWLTALFLVLVALPQAFPTPLYYFQTQTLGLGNEVIGWLKGLTGLGNVLAAPVYAVICRRLPIRRLVLLGIVAAAAGVLLHLLYRSLPAATAIALADGFLAGLCTLALMQVAVWAAPLGNPAIGFALLMSAWNVGDALGDVLAAVLMQRLGLDFFSLVAVYGALTLAMLATLVLLPGGLLARRDGAT